MILLLLNQEQVIRLTQELGEKNCLWCNENNYKIEENAYVFAAQGQDASIEYLPTAVVTCLNCGMEYFFNASIRGLVQNIQVQMPQPQHQASSTPTQSSLSQAMLNIEHEIDRSSRKIYAVEGRAGVLMGVVATVVALLFNIPAKDSSLGYLNISLLAPLLALLPAFGFYMFTFLPSLRFGIHKDTPANLPPNQPINVQLHGLAELGPAIDKAYKTKTKRIRLGHSLFAAGVFGLVVTQLFLKYAEEIIHNQSDFELFLEFLIFVLLQIIVALLVRSLFRSRLLTK